MSSDFQQAFKNIRQSVLGIGHRDNSGFHFVGTGFVFDSSGWILPNSLGLAVPSSKFPKQISSSKE
jgi:hypothetical protein